MKFNPTLAAMVLVAGCSPEAPTAKPPPPTVTVTATAPKEPAPPPTTSPEKQTPATPAVAPNQDPPAAGVHMPVITIRTMDRKAAKVQLNGEDLDVTPCLWTITSSIAYADLRIPSDSMPEGAQFVLSTQHAEYPLSKVDVYVAWRPDDLAKFPGLRQGECVVIVKGRILGEPVRGPLRLYVEGYRFTDYTPLVNPDGDDASRFVRTLWFERISDE